MDQNTYASEENISSTLINNVRRFSLRQSSSKQFETDCYNPAEPYNSFLNNFSSDESDVLSNENCKTHKSHRRNSKINISNSLGTKPNCLRRDSLLTTDLFYNKFEGNYSNVRASLVKTNKKLAVVDENNGHEAAPYTFEDRLDFPSISDSQNTRGSTRRGFDRRRLTISQTEIVIKPDKIAQPKSENSLIAFDDPAMELIDRENGCLKTVDNEMIHNLFPKASYFCIYGSEIDEMNKSFSNNSIEVDTNMVDKDELKSEIFYRLCDKFKVGFSCKKGLKLDAPNQDDFLILKVDDWAMYGVFDGHGLYGHNISHFIQKTLPFLIIGDPEFTTNLEDTLIRAFWRVHHLVEAVSQQVESGFDASMSGSTAVIVIQRDNKLTVAHVGDSRVVLAKRKGTKIVALDLTRDHKPGIPEEKERILKNGGDVRNAGFDTCDRVFVHNRKYPGLSMSRAIGDSTAANVGVSAHPDVKTYDLDSDCMFLILASDGVWEFIDSQRCVELANLLPPQCAVGKCSTKC